MRSSVPCRSSTRSVRSLVIAVETGASVSRVPLVCQVKRAEARSADTSNGRKANRREIHQAFTA